MHDIKDEQILAWLVQKHHLDAAGFLARCDIPAHASTFSRWKTGNRAVPDQITSRIAIAFGYKDWLAVKRDYAETELSLDTLPSEAILHTCLFNQSEDAHLRLMVGAQRVLDTRIGIPSLPDVFYRTKFNRHLHKLIEDGAALHRVETVYTIQRLAELSWGLERHSDNAEFYQLAFAPWVRAGSWMPQINCTIYDDDRGLFGGIHEGGRPTSEPFVEIHGRVAVHFFEVYWQRIWDQATKVAGQEGGWRAALDREAEQLHPDGPAQLRKARDKLDLLIMREPDFLPRP